MSTAIHPTPPAAGVLTTPGRERLLTAADLAAFPSQIAGCDVSYELDNGRLVVMSPPGYRHGRVGGRFVAALHVHGELRGHGEACDEVGVLLRRNPDHLTGPGAAFVAAASCPPRVSPEGYLLTIPELVVEVRSKNDTQPEVDAEVADYLAAGVRLVWVADPDARTVTAHRPAQPAAVSGPSDTLTADPVIPGFAVPVAELFPG